MHFIVTVYMLRHTRTHTCAGGRARACCEAAVWLRPAKPCSISAALSNSHSPLGPAWGSAQHAAGRCPL